MIGENIKALRKTHDLTQPEFAKIVGISRNSLSRYENGTSSVSTELIDRICQKFNVSYIDIVGEEKLLTPVEDYQLTLKIEVIKERGANILAQLYRFQDEQGIAFDDTSNPWVLMSDDLSDLLNTRIYLVASFEDIERFNGYLDGIERMLGNFKGISLSLMEIVIALFIRTTLAYRKSMEKIVWIILKYLRVGWLNIS